MLKATIENMPAVLGGPDRWFVAIKGWPSNFQFPGWFRSSEDAEQHARALAAGLGESVTVEFREPEGTARS